MTLSLSKKPLCVLAVTLTAIAMGSSSNFLALTLLLSGAGVVAFWFQPGKALPRAYLGAGALVAATALTAFLPYRWFDQQPWREAARQDFGIAVGTRLTPQPWVSAEQTVLLFGALAWLAYLITSHWTKAQRRILIHGLMAAFSGLAAFYLALRWQGTPWPGAEHKNQFSPFANPNQLSTLCAMSVALHGGCFMASWRQSNKGRMALSALGLAIALVALIAIGSRMAILLAVIGIVGIAGVHTPRRRRLHLLTLALSVSLLGFAGVFLSDTRLSQRLSTEPAQILENLQQGRLAIYRDTLAMGLHAPVVGHGLGNFPSVFPFSRQASRSEYHIRHPESDWLWWWTELGWPIPVLAIVGLGILIRNPPRLRRHRNERVHDHGLRLGLTAALLLFGLHALIDVPAHRVGSLWPCLLVIGLLVSASPPRPGRQRWTAIAPGGVAVLALILAVCAPRSPVERRPLAWQGYFERAQQDLREGGPTGSALANFQRARFLEPHSALLPLVESWRWLTHAPQFAIAAWHEVMRREPQKSLHHYDRFLKVAKKVPALSWENLRSLAHDDPAHWRIYLQHVPEPHLAAALAELESRPTVLNTSKPIEREQIAGLWARRGNQESLIAFLDRHPTWGRSAGVVRAKIFADKGRFKEACLTLKSHLFGEHLVPPAFLNDLRLAHLRNPTDSNGLIRLIEATIAAGPSAEAERLLAKLERSSFPEESGRLRFLHECARKNWEAAWLAFQKTGHSEMSLAQAKR